MHAAGFGLNPQHPQFAPQYPPPGIGVGAPPVHDPAAAAAAAAAGGGPGMADPSQIQQLVQLLGAKMLPKQTAVVECPKSMVGRVIGKGGETIKSLQQYTGAMIQIDQSTDPTRVTIAGSPQSLQLAVSMVNDIVRGTFKGFAMLRQIALSSSQPGMPGFGQPQPVYVQGYGFVPPSQVYNPDDPLAAAQMLRSSPPTGPLTPPMTPLRNAAAANNLAGGLTPDALAALLGQQQQAAGGAMGGMPGMAPPMAAPAGSQDALLNQLLGQLAGQQHMQQHMQQHVQQPPTMNLQQHQHQHHPQMAQQHQHQHSAPADLPSPAGAGAAHQHLGAPGAAGPDQATIHALLAQAGLLGAAGQPLVHGMPTGGAAGMSAQALPTSGAPGLPASTSLMLSATGAPAVVSSAGSERSVAHAPGGGLSGLSVLSAGSGTASPAQSIGMPVPSSAPAAALAGLAQAAAPGSYLGTSPTPTHSSTGSGRTSPAAALASANPALTTRRPGSDTGSPLGRYGAVGSPSSQGASSSAGIGAAAEEALAARLAATAISPAGGLPGAGSSDLPPSTSSASHVSVMAPSDSMLPPGWAKVTDGQGLVYYVNHVTQESSLTRPTAQGQAAM